jgi:hypothetical protein
MGIIFITLSFREMLFGKWPKKGVWSLADHGRQTELVSESISEGIPHSVLA